MLASVWPSFRFHSAFVVCGLVAVLALLIGPPA